MSTTRNTAIRAAALLLAILGTISLAACGGGSHTTASTVGSGGPTGGGSSTPPASCDNSVGSSATSITPCVTVTGLAASNSITVTDTYTYTSGGTNGSDTITVTGNGTDQFSPVAAVNNQNGTPESGTFPAISFSFNANGLQCVNETATGSYHATIACGTFPAVNPSVPTVKAMSGASTPTVIATPDIVPVMFNSSGSGWVTGNQQNDVTFVQQLVASKVWGLLSQYGVGAASVEPAVSVSNVTSAQIGSIDTASGMASYVQANASSWDSGLTGSTVFLIYMPPNADFQAGTAGYTNQVSVNGTTITYAVVSDDFNPSKVYASGEGPYLSAEAALVDAVTNPTGTDGYASMSANTATWLGAEQANAAAATENLAAHATTVGVGTLCSGVIAGSGVSTLNYPDITISAILPIWSNSDAQAGRNPCEPETNLTSYTSGNVTLSDPTSNFVGVVEQSPAEQSVSGTVNGVSYTDKAIQIQPGQTVNVTFTFFTTQPISGTNSTGNGIPVQAQVVAYVSSNSSTIGANPVVNGDVNNNTTTPALITVGQVTNLKRTTAGSAALNGDQIQVPLTASSTSFTGLYVVTVEANGVPVSLPLAVTEGTSWK